MLLKDISFNEPIDNILFDDVLLQLAEQNDDADILRFWESDKLFIVLGRIGKVEEEVEIENVIKDQIPILRRSSGGGTVLQGKGCLNYSLILSKEKNPKLSDLKASYQFILQKVVDGLGILDIAAKFLPISDIALQSNQRKFSGNAQKRGKKYILHHGTILYDFDLELIEKYLKFPKSVPEYRKGRKHLEFVTNLPVSSSSVKEQLSRFFGVKNKIDEMTQEESFCLEKIKEKREVIVGV